MDGWAYRVHAHVCIVYVMHDDVRSRHWNLGGEALTPAIPFIKLPPARTSSTPMHPRLGEPYRSPQVRDIEPAPRRLSALKVFDTAAS